MIVLKKLRDIIDYNLNILFVGYNPSLRSAELGHHFAGRGNNFWRLLHRSDLTEKLFNYEEDKELLDLDYGITNIVDRPTKAADEITKEEYAEGKIKLRQKVEKYRPLMVCHVGIGVYRTYAGKSKATWGPQEAQIVSGVVDYIVPNPSGLNRMPVEEQLRHYREMKQFLDNLVEKKKARHGRIIAILKDTYPGATTALNFTNPFELLIATMLSAQSTDRQVNLITRDLFQKLKKPADYARLAPEELAEKIKRVGLFKNKSKNIVATCQILTEKYHGQVPQTMEELAALPGVGRKTANVVLANAFHQPAIAVDTHVFRVANRLGLANSRDALGTERDLMKNIPREQWSDAHHWLIYHGRNICAARNPKCGECPVAELCESWE